MKKINRKLACKIQRHVPETKMQPARNNIVCIVAVAVCWLSCWSVLIENRNVRHLKCTIFVSFYHHFEINFVLFAAKQRPRPICIRNNCQVWANDWVSVCISHFRIQVHQIFVFRVYSLFELQPNTHNHQINNNIKWKTGKKRLNTNSNTRLQSKTKFYQFFVSNSFKIYFWLCFEIVNKEKLTRVSLDKKVRHTLDAFNFTKAIKRVGSNRRRHREEEWAEKWRNLAWTSAFGN